MRTTIEISAEHRSSLLELAARRGEKGFSGVVAEAFEAYISAERNRQKHRDGFLALAGTLDEREASELRTETLAVRASWR